MFQRYKLWIVYGVVAIAVIDISVVTHLFFVIRGDLSIITKRVENAEKTNEQQTGNINQIVEYLNAQQGSRK